MSVPTWIEAVFAREYSPSNSKELEKEIKEWLKATGDYPTFYAFFQDFVQRTQHGDYSNGRIHSISNFSKGDYRNCNAIATISAIKGALQFNKRFEVIIEYEGGLTKNGQMKEFISHVSLYDGKRNYGERKNFDNVEEQPEKILALLHMLGDAMVYWKSGDRKKAKKIAAKVEKQMKKEGIESPYIERRLKETNSNF